MREDDRVSNATLGGESKPAPEAADVWTATLESIASVFDESFHGMIQGPQTVSRAFKKLGQDIALSIAQSGIKDRLSLRLGRAVRLRNRSAEAVSRARAQGRVGQEFEGASPSVQSIFKEAFTAS